MNARTLAITRAVAVIGGTGALIAGTTFAALTSNTVTLSDNTVSSATASLKIWNGTTFDVTSTGFGVTGLVPGHPSDPQNFYMENDGGVPLTLTVHVPVTPPAPSDGYGFTGFDNLKVNIIDNATGHVETTDMAALLAGEVALPDTLAAGATGNNQVGHEHDPGNYSVTYDITPAAVTGSHAGVGDFDLVFSGTDATP